MKMKQNMGKLMSARVEGAALYIVIIIAFVIALLCSALIVTAYFYKLEYAKKGRYSLLTSHLDSGTQLLLHGSDRAYTEKKISLFSGEQDSLIIERRPWGLFDVGICRAFIQADTLDRLFFIADRLDAAKWSVLYVIDEDRPLSVSGNTSITGNVFLPKAGIRAAYVDNKAYTGNKNIITGQIRESAKQMPVLNGTRLNTINLLFDMKAPSGQNHLVNASNSNSFQSTLKTVYLTAKTPLLGLSLNGYILIRSDTLVTIDSSARLNNVIICAKAINVAAGFTGKCQLFARDSIHIGKNCRFNYPSVIGVLENDSAKAKLPVQMTIDAGSHIFGTVFTYQNVESQLLPRINMGDQVTITGQLYSDGILKYKNHFVVYGSLCTKRFLYQQSYTAYENYLIDVDFNSKKLSKHYLTSDLSPASSTKQAVLQWLN